MTTTPEERFERALGDVAREAKNRAGSPPDRLPATGHASPLALLLARRHRPADFQAWWEAHGRDCPRCAAVLSRVEEGAGERVIRIPGGSGDRHAFAAESAEDFLAPESSLPRVSFHEAPRMEGSGIDRAWFVRVGSRLLLLLIGPAEGLAAWREGAELRSESGETWRGFVPAAGTADDLICPAGLHPDRERVFLAMREGPSPIAGQAFLVPGLFAGKVRIAPAERTTDLDEVIDDMVSRNRALGFLAAVPEEEPAPGRRLQIGFYLRLLLAQGRVDERARKRLAAVPWIAGDLGELLA